MIDLIIDMLLLRQGIESNPGPVNPINPKLKTNLAVRTYNCNGLGNTDKFRRIEISMERDWSKYTKEKLILELSQKDMNWQMEDVQSHWNKLERNTNKCH